MTRRDIILALIGLVLVIIVAEVTDRWGLSYPIMQSDRGDSPNPAALWSLEVGRFLVALSIVGVGAFVLCRRATAAVTISYAIVGAIGSSARPVLLVTHGDIPWLPPSIVLWAASTNMLKEFAFSGLLAIGIAALVLLCVRRT